MENVQINAMMVMVIIIISWKVHVHQVVIETNIFLILLEKI